MYDEEVDASKLPAITKWSRPGFLERAIGNRKPERLVIDRLPSDNCPIDLNMGNVRMRWENNKWMNLNLNEQVVNTNPSEPQVTEIIRENAQLRVQCEVLLHMLTMSEMNKAKAQNKLVDLKQRIQETLEQYGGENQEEEDSDY